MGALLDEFASAGMSLSQVEKPYEAVGYNDVWKLATVSKVESGGLLVTLDGDTAPIKVAAGQSCVGARVGQRCLVCILGHAALVVCLLRQPNDLFPFNALQPRMVGGTKVIQVDTSRRTYELLSAAELKSQFGREFDGSVDNCIAMNGHYEANHGVVAGCSYVASSGAIQVELMSHSAGSMRISWTLFAGK